jgi:ABC-type branched-subunit amino acid transport system substrate-binding protein
MIGPRHKLIGVLAVLALVAMACGSSKKSSTSSGTSASTSGSATTAGGSSSSSGPVRGVTATSITVGCVGELQAFPGMDDGIKARLGRENKNGGVNGRMFKIIPCLDDNSDGATNLNEVKQVVEKDGAYAVMATSADFLPASSDYLAAQKVPFYGWGFQPGYCLANTWGFSFNGCLSGIFSPAVTDPVLNTALMEPFIQQLGKPASQISLYVASAANDTGKAGLEQYVPLAQKLGIKYQGSVDVPAGGTVTDFSPYVSKIMAGNPDVVMVSTDFQTAPGLTAALKAAGYKGLIYNYVAYVPGLLSAPGQQKLAAALDGTYANTQFPPAEGGGEGITQFQNDLKAAGVTTGITQGNTIGYWSADLFVQMLKAVGPNLNPDNFASVVNSNFKTNPPATGGLGPLSFPDGHSHPAPCAAFVKVQGTQFVVAQPFKCYQNIPAK